MTMDRSATSPHLVTESPSSFRAALTLHPLAALPAALPGTRFQRFDGERAAPGHRATYAEVRLESIVLGIVAVDADLAIWFVTLAAPTRAENAERSRHIQRDLAANGYCVSRHGVLAALYYDLARPRQPHRPQPGRFPGWPGPGLIQPVGADRGDRRQSRDGGAPTAAAVGRGVEVA